MTHINKFDDLNDRFTSLGTGMKFEVRLWTLLIVKRQDGGGSARERFYLETERKSWLLLCQLIVTTVSIKIWNAAQIDTGH